MGFKSLIAKVVVIFYTAISLLYATVAFSNTDVPNDKNVPVLEVIIFQTNASPPPKEVIKASKKVTKVLEKYDGFVKRTFSQNSTVPNQWIDIIEWQTIDDGILAAKKVVNNQDMQNFMHLMKNGYKTYHFDIKFQASDPTN